MGLLSVSVSALTTGVLSTDETLCSDDSSALLDTVSVLLDTADMVLVTEETSSSPQAEKLNISINIKTNAIALFIIYPPDLSTLILPL